MNIITLVITLAIIGFLVWLVITYIPMPEAIRRVIVIFVVVLLVIWLLNIIGFLPLGNITVPRVR